MNDRNDLTEYFLQLRMISMVMIKEKVPSNNDTKPDTIFCAFKQTEGEETFNNPSLV